MSGDGMQVPIDAVRRHAGSVDGVADAMGQARAAVGQVTMDTQAYGQLCQFLPNLLEPVFDAALSVLTQSAEGLRETAVHLRGVADGAAATDRSSAATIRSTLPELPL